MAFTRKHFCAVAKLLKTHRDIYSDPMSTEDRNISKAFDFIARDFVELFANDKPIFDMNGNRRFDKDRFLQACGYPRN